MHSAVVKTTQIVALVDVNYLYKSLCFVFPDKRIFRSKIHIDYQDKKCTENFSLSIDIYPDTESGR